MVVSTVEIKEIYCLGRVVMVAVAWAFRYPLFKMLKVKGGVVWTDEGVV